MTAIIPDYEGEDRLISIGLSSKSRVLLAVHIEPAEMIIRIISCRKATPNERNVYEENSKDF